MSDFQKEELSLEETNKLRISLGLKPLTAEPETEDKQAGPAKAGSDPAGDTSVNDDEHDPLKNQDERAARNYDDYRENLRRQKEDDAIRDRIVKAHNRRELNRKLQGRSLGEAEAGPSSLAGDDVDARKWIKAQKKKAKENAERRSREEAEAEEAAAAAARADDKQDLSGLRVGHDIDDLDLDAGGEGRILTLKDSKVLDDAEDELMDTQAAQSEQDRRNLERKKGAKKYTGLDDDEFDANSGRKKGVLSKYDADVDGKLLDEAEDVGFRLGGDNNTRAARSEAKKREIERMLNRKALDLDYTKNEEVSDYLKEGDVGFKKPKKKKQRAPARVRLDEDDEGESGQTAALADTQMNGGEDERTQRRPELSAEALLDDDDLTASLARARRKQAKRTFQKMTPEQIAKNLRQQQEAERAEQGAASGAGGEAEGMDVDGATVKAEEGRGEAGLTFDDTSEFVRNIQAAQQAAAEADRRGRAGIASSSVKDEPASPEPDPAGVDGDQLLHRSELAHVKEENDEDEEETMGYGDDDRPMVNLQDEANEEEQTDAQDDAATGGGLASTLSYLRNQGLIREVTPEQRERERQQREYDAWLAVRRVEDKVREAEMAANRAQGSAKDQATREYENRRRELDDARKAQEKFKNYTPDIDIKYHDEFGRVLNSHEAWKRLSHQFHGKLPGRKKQNQRLQRIEEERKQQKMLAGDSPSGIANAFTDRTEKTGQAHMVLGVGSRNNAPQDVGMLGPNTLSRADYKGKGRGGQGERESSAGASSSVHVSGMDGSDSVGITSMVPRSTTARTKAGFAPVARTNGSGSLSAQNAEYAGQSGSASPAISNGSAGHATGSPAPAPPASKFKLAFGKRAEPANGSSSDFSRAAKQPRLDS